MRITGILGGSYNPIHNAHLAMAECAHRQFDIPEILLMPTSRTYYKDDSELLEPEKRMDMIRMAIEEVRGQKYMKPSSLDIDRGGVTYTYDTITELKEFYDKIYFIIGTDSFMYIDKWHRSEDFLPECTLLVSQRVTDHKDEVDAQYSYLTESYGADILFMDMEIMPISSSDIRKRIRTGRSVKGMVPDSIVKYIADNGLYKQ